MQLKLLTRLGILAAAVVGTASCASGDLDWLSPLPLQRDASPVQTDSLQYHLRKLPGAYDAYATATYVNRADAPIYFARCGTAATGPLFGLRRSGRDSTADAFIGGAWACVGGVPSGTLLPGDALTVRVWLGSSESPNANPPIQPSERVGRFRVELRLCTAPVADSDNCVLAPQAQRESNAFDVIFESP